MWIVSIYNYIYIYKYQITTLLEERVPRGTLKGNSDCFIFGYLKEPYDRVLGEVPFDEVPLGTPRVLWSTTRKGPARYSWGT